MTGGNLVASYNYNNYNKNPPIVLEIDVYLFSSTLVAIVRSYVYIYIVVAIFLITSSTSVIQQQKLYHCEAHHLNTRGNGIKYVLIGSTYYEGDKMLHIFPIHFPHDFEVNK